MIARIVAAALLGWAALASAAARAEAPQIEAPQIEAPKVTYVDQGPAWTAATRSLYYREDQGSQLMPLAWLQALRQPDGKPFLADAMARYGFLPNAGPANPAALPVGFTDTPSAQGRVAGMTCSACHVREIIVDKQRYRIDGGPALIDFQAFAGDLDEAVARVLASDETFRGFAETVLAKTVLAKTVLAKTVLAKTVLAKTALAERAADAAAVASLRSDVTRWWERYHLIMSRSLPKDRTWGPSRLDAMSMIFNRLAGLDLGAEPTHAIPENIRVADAPTRYPFLWNSSRQDFSQWVGFAANGNDFLALARNLGQLYGVFGAFHPRKLEGAALDHDYLSENSANFVGLATNEDLVKKIGPPVWPWALDRALAKRGEAIFARPAVAGGCAECHGIAPGAPRPPAASTWKTRIEDVGTDNRQWTIILRPVRTGSMEGAQIPGAVPPLRSTDLALSTVKVAVIGAILEYQGATMHKASPSSADGGAAASMKADTMAAMKAEPAREMDGAMKLPMQGSAASAPTLMKDAYEARVLQGIWAAAPYLHNGSVATLADLLEPAARRAKSFEIGPAYDPATVGLAARQPAPAFTLRTTGCEDRGSGDSRCGHEYGTRLSAPDKAALLEYLKSL